MSTTNYNLPTIASTDRIDGVDAINGLANAVDAQLKSITDSIAGGGGGYALPAATTSALGGVIVGEGLSVQPAGTLSVNSAWLQSHIESAVAAYFTAHVHPASTWGELSTNGFAFVDITD